MYFPDWVKGTSTRACGKGTGARNRVADPNSPGSLKAPEFKQNGSFQRLPRKQGPKDSTCASSRKVLFRLRDHFSEEGLRRLRARSRSVSIPKESPTLEPSPGCVSARVPQ